MKYKVSVGYISTTFTDRLEALDFAEKAKLHADDDAAVTIKLLNEEKEAKEA